MPRVQGMYGGPAALCQRYSFVGSGRQCALAEYVAVPARNVVRIPDSVSLQDAALVEPLTIALHGVDKARYELVERVAVFGAGVIGLLTVMVPKDDLGAPPGQGRRLRASESP